MMIEAAARLYGLEGEVSTDLSFRSEIVAVVASSESALGAFRANLIPQWAKFVCVEPAPPMSVDELREIHARAEAAGYVLVEPERAMKGGTAIERAIYAFVTDGSLAKVFLFVPRVKAKRAKLKETRVLDCVIESKLEMKTGDLAEAAFALLRERGAMRGSELLREARSRFGETSTRDAQIVGAAIVTAWFSSQVALSL